MNVTSMTALQVTAVWGCIRAISQDFSKIPPELKRKLPGGGFETVTDHPVARLLVRPNRWQTWNEFAKFMMLNKLLGGNAYAVRVVDTAGRIAAIVPVRYDDVTIYDGHDDILYDVHPSNRFVWRQIGGGRQFERSEVHHVRDLSRDGICGLSPIAYAREVIGHACAEQAYGASFFGSGAHPGGVLESPQGLSPEAARRLKGSWEEAHRGVGNSHRTAVLEDGVTYKPLSMSNKDSQFIESRQFSVIEICRIFRVPPHKVQSMERSTFSNIEEQNIEYVTDTLIPHFEDAEMAMKRDLLSGPDDEDLYIDHDANRLMRGNATVRFATYATRRNWGIITANEARAREGLGPIPGGDDALMPMNMQVMGEAGQGSGVAESDQPPEGDAPP
ncbi:MAG: phage portal protein [Pseudomonadota bacterium]